MRQRTDKYTRFTSLVMHDARTQAKIAMILMAVIPSLSLFYMGMAVTPGNNQFAFPVKMLIFALTMAVAVAGFLILRKYPDNILRLRQYITEIAKGTLPDKIVLVDAQNSDDIKYIENSFNCVLAEMRNRIEAAEEQLRAEHALKETIERQQQALLEAERHRVMIQTLGAACHHIGQPATVLQVRLEFLQKLATDKEEIAEIEKCAAAMNTIADVLHQLQRVSEFRTVPYITDDTILAIGPETQNDRSLAV